MASVEDEYESFDTAQRKTLRRENQKSEVERSREGGERDGVEV